MTRSATKPSIKPRASSKPKTGQRLPEPPSYTFTPLMQRVVRIGIPLLAVVAGLLYVLPMASIAGALGFPLDDAWIPLTFARTLAEHGSWAYHASDAATPGSTSPLYVLLLAIARLLTTSEFIPTFAIGIAAFAATACFVFRSARLLYPADERVAAAAALIIVLHPKLQSAAVSGMATMLYVALLSAAVYLYLRRDTRMFLITAAIALWVRPDALILLLAAALLALYERFLADDASPAQVRPTTSAASPVASPAAGTTAAPAAVASPAGPRPLWRLLLAPAVIVIAYIGMNLSLGGGIFPNSVAAKLAYFGGMKGGSFASSAIRYFFHPVSGVLFLFVAVTIGVCVSDLAHRRRNESLILLLIIGGTVLAYGIFLPFLYNDGRYFAPLLPLFILAAVAGLRQSARLLQLLFPAAGVRKGVNALAFVVFAIVAIVAVTTWSSRRSDHYMAIQYVQERHVAAARWLRANAPNSTVVATHVIGAIGYYSGCRTLDMIGIVTPAVIPSIGNLQELSQIMTAAHARYVAALRERFEVVNANAVFSSDQTVSEIMEIFAWDPERTHIMAQRATVLNAQAVQYMQQSALPQAMQMFQESYRMDPASSRTTTLMGVCLLQLKDTANAIKMLDESLRLHPQYASAMLPLGDIYAARGQYTDALKLLRRANELNPTSEQTRTSLARVAKQAYEDSLRLAGWTTITKTMDIEQ